MAEHPIDRIIIIDQDLFTNQTFISTLEENFNVPVELQEDLESYDENAQNVIYVSSLFEGPLFEKLVVHKKPVISDIIVQDSIVNRKALPLPKHPLFNYYMTNSVICFSTNDKKKTDIINKYLNLIRFMGGQSRRDMRSGKSFDRTHLIESTTNSDNYKLAVIYGIPILYKEWIDFVWENRRNSGFVLSDSKCFLEYKLKPFLDLKISLLNFSSKQKEELTRKINQNDGMVVAFDEEGCTHLVINDSKQINYIDILEKSSAEPKYVVSEKWLFTSLETLNREDEESHKLKVPHLESNNLHNTPSKDDSIAHQTLNSILLSPNYDNSIDESLIVDKSDLKKQAITQELYQTEENYVNILKDIVKVYHDPIKNHTMPGLFPNEIEMKTIFGGLPPIINVHGRILTELEPVVKDWKPENDVGKIFEKHSKDFLTVYPQYINYYEKTKEMIEMCTEKYSKFAAFLKVCQTLTESRKQKLHELLINPIQRLPRIEMYLRALLNKTNNLHPDYKRLNEALNTIVSVNSEINNKKKKTEGQMEMFDMLNDIEECPATLLSANRQFISKCDVKLLNQNDVGSVYKLDNYLFSLLLFTDLIVLCKKRMVKRTNSLRDRTSTISSTVTKKTKKSYKYIETIDIPLIKYIFSNFEETEMLADWENAFAIVSASVSRFGNFLVYPFVVKDPEMKKQTFIKDLVKSFENSVEKSFENPYNDDLEITLNQGSFKNLDFSHSKTIARNLNKSKYVFMRTKEKINRTFSVRRSTANLLSSVSMENLNTTQSTNSPSSVRFSRVFTNFLTPKENHIRNSRKLGSINDLSTQEEENGNFSLPTTPAPRKKKYQESNS